MSCLTTHCINQLLLSHFYNSYKLSQRNTNCLRIDIAHAFTILNNRTSVKLEPRHIVLVFAFTSLNDYDGVQQNSTHVRHMSTFTPINNGDSLKHRIPF